MTRRSCLAAVMACVCLNATASAGEQYYHYTPKPVASEDKPAAGDGVLVKEIPVKKGDTLYDLSRKFSGKGFYYPQILLFNDIKDPNKIYTGDMIKIPLGSKTPEIGKTGESVHQDSSRDKSSKAARKKVRKQRLQASVTPEETKQAGNAVELSSKELQQLNGATRAQVSADKRRSQRNNKTTKTATKKISAQPSPNVAEMPLQPTVQPEPGKTAAADASSSGQKTYERALKAFRQDDYSTALDLFERFIAENPGSPLAADANLYKAECYLKQSGL